MGGRPPQQESATRSDGAGGLVVGPIAPNMALLAGPPPSGGLGANEGEQAVHPPAAPGLAAQPDGGRTPAPASPHLLETLEPPSSAHDALEPPTARIHWERSTVPPSRPADNPVPCDVRNKQPDVAAALHTVGDMRARLTATGFLDPDLASTFDAHACYGPEALWDRHAREAFERYARDRLERLGHQVADGTGGLHESLKRFLGISSAVGGSRATDANVTHAALRIPGPWTDGHLPLRTAAAIMDRLDAAMAQASLSAPGPMAMVLKVH
ncbi:MAG TPA: hypothetical protein DDX54_06145 [Rhodospirillaceae bacterium]|jgi:hypothetical protein|nr:hypothetical protein [Alphaproteobacteria bacterium]HBH26965.1 hypothetical protein [Rhodospirillaceae bacterium]